MIKKQYCQNCVNKRKPEFMLKIGGLNILLCETCWIGFSYGLKKDWETFDTDEVAFKDLIKKTGEYENKTN